MIKILITRVPYNIGAFQRTLRQRPSGYSIIFSRQRTLAGKVLLPYSWIHLGRMKSIGCRILIRLCAMLIRSIGFA